MNRQKKVIYLLDVPFFLRHSLFAKSRQDLYYYGLSTGMKVLLRFLDKIIFIKTRIQPYVPNLYLSEYTDAFFRIERLTVDLTEKIFKESGADQYVMTKVYAKHYKTDKTGIVIKYLIQERVRNFLRCLYNLQQSSEGYFLIAPDNALYKFIVNQSPFEDLKRIVIIFGSRSGRKVYKSLYFLFILASNMVYILRQRYVFVLRPREFAPVCMRVHTPKSEGLLRSDFIIDGKDITKRDILFMVESDDGKWGKAKAEYVQQNHYRNIILNKASVPFSKIGEMIFEYLGLPSMLWLASFKDKDDCLLDFLLGLNHAATNFRYEQLFLNYQIRIMYSPHSAGVEMILLPLMCSKYGSKFAVYNFGVTVSTRQWAPYCFQFADYYFVWGKNILLPYEKTCRYDNVILVGFWGKEEYRKISFKKDELKQRILRTRGRVVCFYDVPYFYQRSTFPARYLLDFYKAALECSVLPDVSVIIKMKSRINIDGAIYPEGVKIKFKELWQIIQQRGNIVIVDTAEYDPLHILAISDINVSFEFGTPSLMALICGKPGIFYNVLFNYSFFSFYPKYFNKIIFDNVGHLVEAVKKHLNKEIDLATTVESKDLEGFDAYQDEKGLLRYRETLKNILKTYEKNSV